MQPFLLIYDLAGLAVGLALLGLSPSRRNIPFDLLRLTILAAVLVGAAGFAGGKFAVLRALCHGMFCVGAPVVAVLGILRWRQRRSWAILLLGTALLAEGVYAYAVWIEPRRLDVTVDQVTSARLRGLQAPLTIAVITDIQTGDFGAHEERVFAEIRARQPDLVVMLGDYIQMDVTLPAFEVQRRRLRELVATLDPPLGIFAVNGDSERAFDRGDAFSNWHKVLFEGTAVQNAVRQKFVLPTEPPIQLLGYSPSQSRFHRTGVNKAFNEFDGFTIALGHSPDYMWPVLKGVQYDALFLAGHTHGGQVVIPGYGPPIILSSVPRWLGAGGVFRRGRTWLAVCRGIGMERLTAPRVRFWCPPQLMFLELGPE